MCWEDLYGEWYADMSGSVKSGCLRSEVFDRREAEGGWECFRTPMSRSATIGIETMLHAKYAAQRMIQDPVLVSY